MLASFDIRRGYQAKYYSMYGFIPLHAQSNHMQGMKGFFGAFRNANWLDSYPLLLMRLVAKRNYWTSSNIQEAFLESSKISLPCIFNWDLPYSIRYDTKDKQIKRNNMHNVISSKFDKCQKNSFFFVRSCERVTWTYLPVSRKFSMKTNIPEIMSSCFWFKT